MDTQIEPTFLVAKSRPDLQSPTRLRPHLENMVKMKKIKSFYTPVILSNSISPQIKHLHQINIRLLSLSTTIASVNMQ